MTIVSIKIGAEGDLRRVELSDGSFLSFRTCYLPQPFDESLYNLDGIDTAEGRELDHDEEEGFRFASACFGAEKTALRLIARAEQTAFGLSRKLKNRGRDPACVAMVISRLYELGLLDDGRYARLWLESRINRQASSPLRLLAALRSRGIDRDDAESALKKVLDDDAEQRLLERFMQKRQRGHKNGAWGLRPAKAASPTMDDEAARRSRKYLLRSEGFSSLAIELFFEGS